MEKQELERIKKILYREDIEARLVCITASGLGYHAYIPSELENRDIIVVFLVPFNEIVTALFYPQMNAKDLIRWINSIV